MVMFVEAMDYLWVTCQHGLLVDGMHTWLLVDILVGMHKWAVLVDCLACAPYGGQALVWAWRLGEGGVKRT